MKNTIYLLLFLGLSLNAQQDFNYPAFINDVYDGDTVTATIFLGFDTYTVEKIRLFGIDAPEMKGEEKAEGVITRDTLRSYILGKNVRLQTLQDKKGKYGRRLGIIVVDSLNINNWLVEKGFAEKAEY